MRFRMVALLGFIAFWTGKTHSPSVNGSLTGVVSGPNGAVPDAPIQAKNRVTGVVVRAMTKPDGRYTLQTSPQEHMTSPSACRAARSNHSLKVTLR
jgi:hypothetical protein